MIASITADPVGILAAFGAGILSFLSPCVLPLVPGYLSMVSGLSAAELATAGAGAGAGTAGDAAPSTTIRPVLRGIGLFVSGFTVVFVALGATASGIGRLLKSHELVLSHISGITIVVLGSVLVASALPAPVWTHVGAGVRGAMTRLTGERRFDVRPSMLGTWAAPVMGMAFAFAWTPCIGPVLGAVLGLAAANGTLVGGVVLLFAYSLGLAVPFIATGLAFGRFTTFFGRARRRLWVVELVAGVVLVLFGVLLLTNHVSTVSTAISNWLNDIGLGRLSRS